MPAPTVAYTLRYVKGSPLSNNELDGTLMYLKERIDASDVVIGDNTFTNSAELAALLDDETGSAGGGKAVFNISPAFVTSITTASTTFALLNTSATTINFAGGTNTLNIGNTGCATTLQGTLSVKGDVIAYATSDIRLKTNVRVIGEALAKLMTLRGVTWDWKDDVREDLKASPTTGVIAQDVEKVLPEVVSEREDGTKAVNYEHMIGLLIEAIRELNEKIDRL